MAPQSPHVVKLGLPWSGCHVGHHGPLCAAWNSISHPSWSHLSPLQTLVQLPQAAQSLTPPLCRKMRSKARSFSSSSEPLSSLPLSHILPRGEAEAQTHTRPSCLISTSHQTAPHRGPQTHTRALGPLRDPPLPSLCQHTASEQPGAVPFSRRRDPTPYHPTALRALGRSEPTFPTRTGEVAAGAAVPGRGAQSRGSGRISRYAARRGAENRGSEPRACSPYLHRGHRGSSGGTGCLFSPGPLRARTQRRCTGAPYTAVPGAPGLLRTERGRARLQRGRCPPAVLANGGARLATKLPIGAGRGSTEGASVSPRGHGHRHLGLTSIRGVYYPIPMSSVAGGRVRCISRDLTNTPEPQWPFASSSLSIMQSAPLEHTDRKYSVPVLSGSLLYLPYKFVSGNRCQGIVLRAHCGRPPHGPTVLSVFMADLALYL